MIFAFYQNSWERFGLDDLYIDYIKFLQRYNYHITVECNVTTVTSQLITTIQLSHHSLITRIQLSHHSWSQGYNCHITVDCNNTTVTSQLIKTVQLSHHCWSQRYSCNILVFLFYKHNRIIELLRFTSLFLHHKFASCLRSVCDNLLFYSFIKRINSFWQKI